jgi:DNA modification methylase
VTKKKKKTSSDKKKKKLMKKEKVKKKSKKHKLEKPKKKFKYITKTDKNDSILSPLLSGKAHSESHPHDTTTPQPADPAAPQEVNPTTKRNFGPMTQKDYEKSQSVIRRVVDPDTGRSRLVKGDGEILEEIVSKEQHRAINRVATQGDGLSFQSGLKKLN